MRVSAWKVGLVVALEAEGVNGFAASRSSFGKRRLFSGHVVDAGHAGDSAESSGGWSASDDWFSLSSEGDRPSSESLYSPGTDMMDPALAAAKGFEEMQKKATAEGGYGAYNGGEEEMRFVQDTIDSIQLHTDPSDPPLYDTAASMEEYARSVKFATDAGKEISMLVRCNESPQMLLVEEGRALPPITLEESHHVSQLVTLDFKPTEFFNHATQLIFHEHAIKHHTSQQLVLERAAVAAWMTKSLSHHVGKHDISVGAVISRYSTYGTGHLTLDEFRNLYLDAIRAGTKDRTRPPSSSSSSSSPYGSKKLKQSTIENLWRDFEAHDILSPIDQDRKIRQQQIDAQRQHAQSSAQTSTAQSHPDTLMDECEILSWEEDNASPQYAIDTPGSGGKMRRSSHELVEMASDGITPKRIKDGQFVFIDEESCIGCTQCAQIAPSSFTMLESGRARSFHQTNSPDVPVAVSACPVNCMHFVAFHELKEMETFRDGGDGRNDHRHLGRASGHTPLNVAGIDSDNNHKSSWYHYLKHKCHMSSQCPKRGCYDCPHFSEKGANPFFQERHDKAQRVRAKDIMASGEADIWRKTAEL